MYGEWKHRWADNQNEFDIEVLRLGYPDQFNVDNPHPLARQKLSDAEQEVVERLVGALFRNPQSQQGKVPFSSTRARFLGHIHFLPGWMLKS
jgi:hypothetical protein